MAMELVKTEQNALAEKSEIAVEDRLEIIDEYVRRKYLTRLSDMQIMPLGEIPPLEEDLIDNVRLYRITEMVYQKDESVMDKFTTVFNTLETYNASVFFLIDSDGKQAKYYLGVRNIASDEQYTGLSRQGYLFNNIRNEKFNLMTRFTTEIIELLFSNREGSVLKYDFANGHIVPVLDEVEYGEKEDLFIKAVQKAALDFLKVVERDKFLIREEKIPEDIIMKAYSRFAVQPALSVLEIFKNFQVLNGKVRSILPEHGILYYMVHIRKLKQDFEESSCKILFLKEIFKVNLPYFEILERLLSKYDNERAK